jgi:pimeloyl-ACP methyl ester carboxylesterase
VDGAQIAWRAWGRPGPGIILVHGGGAHSRWWDHIAPFLADDGWRVAALDLSGHGDSDWRDEYSLEQWGREALAVGKAAGVAGEPILVGHSMGGMVSYAAACAQSEELAGVIIFDSPIFQRTQEQKAADGQTDFGPIRVYPTHDDALAHFRFVPGQVNGIPAVREHVAETSMKAVPGGFSWKFDPRFVSRRLPSAALGAPAPHGNLAYFRSGNGIVGDEQAAEMKARFGKGAIFADIPETAHHVMIDRPLALIAAVRTVLSAWDIES